MANEFQTDMCSTVSMWNTMRDFNKESITWNTTQPSLPVELNQIQPSFGDASLNQFDAMNDRAFFLPQISRVPSPSKQQLNFFNRSAAQFWNPSTNSFEDESICSNYVKRSETTKVRSEPASKKPRIATPPPLPTFKVRKEKLGDRITALQQLVSPFGKTDTSSVLQEAIDYIKFLHGQVGVLSTPYLKNDHEMQHQKGLAKSKDEQQDLRSRGLCLVPVSSTFAVASEAPVDFWVATILGSYI